MEKQRIAVSESLNRDTGPGWHQGGLKRVLSSIVCQLKSDFVLQRLSDDLPVVQRLRLASRIGCPPEASLPVLQSTYYPLQTSRNLISKLLRWFCFNRS